MQPYALSAPLFVMSSAIVMNYDAYHSLPSDYQQILKSCLLETLTQEQSEISSQDDSGLELSHLSQEDQETLRALATPLLNEILETVDPELVQALQEEIAQHLSDS